MMNEGIPEGAVHESEIIASPEMVQERGQKVNQVADSVKLENDGNWTKQFYKAVDFDTLVSDD